MRIPRLYQPCSLSVGHPMTVCDEVAHRLTRVLRMQVGQPVVLFNGQGGEFLGEITTMDKRQVVLAILEHRMIDRMPLCHIELGQAIIKADHMDWLIQKATELGVRKITPLFTEYTQTKHNPSGWKKKLQHWQKIVIHACEQSGRNRLLEMGKPLFLAQWLTSEFVGNQLVLHPGSAQRLTDIIAASHSQTTTSKNCDIVNSLVSRSDDTLSEKKSFNLLVGPEGGLAEQEYELAIQHGFEGINLGASLLRAETAAIAAISILRFS